MKGRSGQEENWQEQDSHKFWRELSHPDHIVQIYKDDEEFLENLVVFASTGFSNGESVVVIATAEHIRQLDGKLRDIGFNIFELRLRDQYITLDANQVLYEFIVSGSPDVILFRLLASNLMKRAKRSGRKVRAFGEAVAILWARGNHEGTICLEGLWNEYMADETFSLFCAYPKSVFGETSTTELNMKEVCNSHSYHVDSAGEQGVLRFRQTGG